MIVSTGRGSPPVGAGNKEVGDLIPAFDRYVEQHVGFTDLDLRHASLLELRGDSRSDLAANFSTLDHGRGAIGVRCGPVPLR